MLKYIFLAKCIFFSSLLYGQINHAEFAARRAKLMTAIDKGVIVLKGTDEVTRNGNVEYPFRQYSDFYYLTGFDEPGASLILLPEEKKFIMFVKNFDPKKALWSGETYGLARTKEIFKADSVIDVDSFEVSLKKFLKNEHKIFLLKKDTGLKNLLSRIIQSDTVKYPAKIEALDSSLENLRLIKSPYEIEMLQKAVDITTEALHTSFQFITPGKFEYELKGLIQYTYTMNNSPRFGFPSIVASGPNATVLHYRDYARQIEDGDLVLFDIGAEYGMYSADISRTIPASGRFSERQKDIYKIVLEAQKAGIEACKPGAGLREISTASKNIIKEGLFKLGLITDKESSWQMSVWLMHGISHWLGMDVHDSGSYESGSEKGKILEPGMVFTVEPGIYISQLAFDSFPEMLGKMVPAEEIESFKVAVRPAFEKYKNIAVRIEDDILITEDGYKNLSEKVVKEIIDIENIITVN